MIHLLSRSAIRLGFVLGLLILCAAQGRSQSLWGRLEPGPHGIGFTTDQVRGLAGDTTEIRLNVWYPTANAIPDMRAADYVNLGIIKPGFDAPTEADLQKEIDMLANLVRRIYGVANITSEQVAHALTLPMKAAKDAALPQEPRPAVLMFADPYSQSVTAEFLASHGYVVITPTLRFAPSSGPRPDSLMYTKGTRVMEWLLEHTRNIPYVDQDRITSLGFGGGIQSPFYLTMLTDRVKALANFDGGVFDARSLTTVNVDYHPERMRTPMLNLMTSVSLEGESASEKAALTQARLYNAAIQNPRFRHHDLAIYGRIIHKGILPDNPESRSVDASFAAAHYVLANFLGAVLEGEEFVLDPKYAEHVVGR